MLLKKQRLGEKHISQSDLSDITDLGGTPQKPKESEHKVYK